VEEEGGRALVGPVKVVEEDGERLPRGEGRSVRDTWSVRAWRVGGGERGGPGRRAPGRSGPSTGAPRRGSRPTPAPSGSSRRGPRKGAILRRGSRRGPAGPRGTGGTLAGPAASDPCLPRPRTRCRPPGAGRRARRGARSCRSPPLPSRRRSAPPCEGLCVGRGERRELLPAVDEQRVAPRGQAPEAPAKGRAGSPAPVRGRCGEEPVPALGNGLDEPGVRGSSSRAALSSAIAPLSADSATSASTRPRRGSPPSSRPLRTARR